MLTALSLVVILICLYVSAGLLLLWAVDLDGYARRRAYSTPAPRAPLGLCRERWESECVR